MPVTISLTFRAYIDLDYCAWQVLSWSSTLLQRCTCCNENKVNRWEYNTTSIDFRSLGKSAGLSVTNCSSKVKNDGELKLQNQLQVSLLLTVYMLKHFVHTSWLSQCTVINWIYCVVTTDWISSCGKKHENRLHGIDMLPTNVELVLCASISSMLEIPSSQPWNTNCDVFLCSIRRTWT